MNGKILSFPLALPFFVLLLLLPFFLLAILALANVSATVVVGRALGVSPLVALGIYLVILVGSVVNIPVYEFKSDSTPQAPQSYPYFGSRFTLPSWHGRRSVIAVNLGGCIIPVLLSIYFALKLPLTQLFVCAAIVALGVYYFTRPVRHAGVMVPVIIPPLLAIGAAGISLYLGQSQMQDLARIAFASGVFGTILGADLLHLGAIRKAGADFVSIGGAGTFDSILLTGVLATIFAAVISSL